MHTHFPIIILVGRPAAGKSEIIHALNHMTEEKRRTKFYIADFKVIDDFPMLWSWLEEDELLENYFEQPRIHTTPDGYFLYEYLWHLLIRKLNLEYMKWRRDHGEGSTVILEFSRGISHGGYQTAFQHFDDLILSESSIMYIDVSFEESLRKNRARYSPERPDSILEHGLSDEKLTMLYSSDDWRNITENADDFLSIKDHSIPFVTFHNEDDVTTKGGEALEQRLEEAFSRLWSHFQRV